MTKVAYKRKYVIGLEFQWTRAHIGVRRQLAAVYPNSTKWGPCIQMPKSIGGTYHPNHYSLTDILYKNGKRSVDSKAK